MPAFPTYGHGQRNQCLGLAFCAISGMTNDSTCQTPFLSGIVLLLRWEYPNILQRICMVEFLRFRVNKPNTVV